MRGEWNVSIRRACRVFEVDTSTYHYKSRRPGQAVLEQRIKEICQTRVRYGYRRIHVLLRREGCRHGQNKTRRMRSQPAIIDRAGKLYPPAVQSSATVHGTENSSQERSSLRSQIIINVGSGFTGNLLV